MAGIVYDLLEVLKQQKECYEGLLTLSEYKTEAVTAKDLEVLTEIVEREECFIGRVNLLDKKREQLLKDIGLVTGMPYKAITVTKIIEKMGKDLPISTDLSDIRTALVALTEKLQKQNQLNKTLLENALELLDFSVNAMQSTRAYVPDAQYSKPGEELTRESISFFDQKQ